MAIFFFRPETDDQDRRVLALYNNECWEIKLVELVELGPRIAVRPFPHHMLTAETSRLVRTILEWAEFFQDDRVGKTAFENLWCSQPLEGSCATKVEFTSRATLALEEAKVFLQELPRDLGRGSLNGMLVQLGVKIDEALR